MLFANFSLTFASNPTPHVQKNGWPLAVQWSMVSNSSERIMSMALFMSIGMRRCLASPFPEPLGMMPNFVAVWHSALAVSFTFRRR